MENEHLNPGQIGQDSAVQNLQDAIERAQGKYADPAARLSEAQRFPVGPMANDKRPFKGAGG